MTTRKLNLLALLGAAAVTALVVSGLSNASSSAKPVNTSPPTISGTAVEGQTLKATAGSWTSSGDTNYYFQWLQCDASGKGCANISGATGKSYLLRSSDVGNTVKVRVKATNADGSTTKDSAASDVVKAKSAPPPATGCPSGNGPVDVSKLSQPARLLIDGQTISPSVVTRSSTDVTMRFHVSACGGRSVSGAFVYAAAVPYDQFTVPAEAQSGADGWATLTTQQAARFPASPRQQQLTVFVRARKPGESLLGGISTRRLVSFPVNVR